MGLPSLALGEGAGGGTKWGEEGAKNWGGGDKIGVEGWI